MLVKIAARQSDLARLQAFEVGRALEKADPKLKVEFSFRSSLGDQRADDPLWKMPEKGVFTEDFVADILSGAVDLVVHSWKDLPIIDREGTRIVATLARADARDVLLVRRDRWAKRAGKFRVLTSSPRRIYNLEPFLKTALPWGEAGAPPLEFVPVRGNIATRVKKLVSVPIEESYDALVVAKAALDRLLSSAKYGADFAASEKELRAAMGLVEFVVLPLSVNPAAAAQGALAIEVRSDRRDLIALCEKIDSPIDRACVEAERRELAKHGGGCHQKIGVTVLDRPYGHVQFIKGLTDAGLKLDSIKLLRGPAHVSAWPKAAPSEIFSGEMKSLSRSMIRSDLPSGSFFVARANAWPDDARTADGEIVWTAGLQTWQKLAARGVWVNGSNESLGEIENPQVDVLAGRKISWLRLTHEDAARDQVKKNGMPAFATYRVEIEPPSISDLQRAKYFFWKSGSQFQQALSVCPAIAKGYHGSGPGKTFEVLTKNVAPERIAVFLSEADFLERVRK